MKLCISISHVTNF